MLRIEHEHPDRHQHARQAKAKRNQENQSEADMPECDRAEQQHQRRGTWNQAAARTERNQGTRSNVTLRHVGMRMRMAVLMVVMVMMRVIVAGAVSMIVIVRMPVRVGMPDDRTERLQAVVRTAEALERVSARLPQAA